MHAYGCVVNKNKPLAELELRSANEPFVNLEPRSAPGRVVNNGLKHKNKDTILYEAIEF